MVEAPDIDALLAGPLGRWLEEQAIIRAAARKRSNDRIVWSVALALPLLSFLWFVPFLPRDLFFFLALAAAAGAAAWAWAPRAEAIRQTKTGINTALAGALGLGYSHDCEPGASFGLACAFAMLPRHDRASFEDLWSGTIGGLAFALHEAHLEERRGAGKNRHWATVFRGPVIAIASPREFRATTLIERSGRHRRLGFLGEKDEVELAGITLGRIAMVHPAFEDSFTLYASDPVEARWLVDPLHAERLIALEEAFAGQDLKALFHAGSLTVTVRSDNLFESGSMDPARDRALVERTAAQFVALAGLAAAMTGEPKRAAAPPPP